MSGNDIYKSKQTIYKKKKRKKILILTSIFFIKNNPSASWIHMKEQQTRKIQQFHPEIEDGFRSEEIAPKVL